MQIPGEVTVAQPGTATAPGLCRPAAGWYIRRQLDLPFLLFYW